MRNKIFSHILLLLSAAISLCRLENTAAQTPPPQQDTPTTVNYGDTITLSTFNGTPADTLLYSNTTKYSHANSS